jgi:hypothetical protein
MSEADNACWYCWCGGLTNPKRQIRPGDIGKALDWYRQNAGVPGRAIRLHPKVMSLAVETPDGVEVIPHAGTLVWSIDVASVVPTTATSIKAISRGQTVQEVSGVGRANMSTLDDKRTRVDKLEPVTPKRPIGRKPGPRPMFLPTDRVRHLAGQGLGAKAIATLLRRDDQLDVSYKTVERLLRGQKALL